MKIRFAVALDAVRNDLDDDIVTIRHLLLYLLLAEHGFNVTTRTPSRHNPACPQVTSEPTVDEELGLEIIDMCEKAPPEQTFTF